MVGLVEGRGGMMPLCKIVLSYFCRLISDCLVLWFLLLLVLLFELFSQQRFSGLFHCPLWRGGALERWFWLAGW